jgi:hypothetical protein
MIPEPVHLESAEQSDLLLRSGARLMRYFTRQCKQETEFWWVGCSSYAPSKKARNQIRRAYKNCTVRAIDGASLRESGYSCYTAAFARFGASKPISEGQFRGEIDQFQGGPFEFYGVFVGESIAGYVICVTDGDYVALLNMKLDPGFFDAYPAYALLDTLCSEYVERRRYVLWNGYRSISHDTNMQDFLGKFGFVRNYCDLKVIYPRKFRALVNAVYPFHLLIDKLPRQGMIPSLQALLFQESIARSFNR